MLYKSSPVQMQHCPKPLPEISQPSWQMPNDRSIPPPVSCDPHTYNWLHNAQSRDGSMTPPVGCSSHLYNYVYQHQDQIVSPVTLDYSMPYRCTFVGQLQGSYEVEVAGGVAIINVALQDECKGDQQHAIVRQVCKEKKTLPDKYIHEEFAQFILCSNDGSWEAVMIKGMNMRVSVEWTMRDGSKTIWRRTNDVVFNMVSYNSLVDPNSRRSSTCSVTSYSSMMSNTIGWIPEPPVDQPGLGQIRPELLVGNSIPQEPGRARHNGCRVGARKVTLLGDEKECVPKDDTSGDSVDCSLKKQTFTVNTPSTISIPPEPSSNCETIVAQCSSGQVSKNDTELYHDIMKLCTDNPSILKQILKWGDKQMTMTLSREDREKLSRGRVWVTARLFPKTKSNAWQGAINELKGAYQESDSGSGIYIQPAQPRSNLKRYRIVRNSKNLWVIELNSGGCDNTWSTCVEELPGRMWVDHRFNRKSLKITVVPLIRILERMAGKQTPENTALEKCLQFLFSTCNQKKLSKFKSRNLKHNIANLKVKLDKQHSLAFAVCLSTVAEKIAGEIN